MYHHISSGYLLGNSIKDNFFLLFQLFYFVQMFYNDCGMLQPEEKHNKNFKRLLKIVL